MNGDIGHSIGHENNSLKDNRRLSVAEDFSRKLDSFLINDITAAAILKIEKLASAVYLVSGLLSDNEPMKWSVRKIASGLLSDITPNLFQTGGGRACPIENISSEIFQMTSILKVAWMGGLISKMNYEILTSEYLKLNDFLVENFKTRNTENNTIENKFFASEEISSVEARIRSKVEENIFLREEFLNRESTAERAWDKNISRRDFVKDISSKGHLSDRKDIVLKNTSGHTTEKLRSLSESILGAVSDRNKRERHDKILGAMSPGISYSVSEIISVLGKNSDTSEKTIQRDLQLLVNLGRLKKTGERRWSRYSLS